MNFKNGKVECESGYTSSIWTQI